jgi:hypothetical protein
LENGPRRRNYAVERGMLTQTRNDVFLDPVHHVGFFARDG